MKRNPARFPEDFIFRLSKEEAEAVQISRSQTVTLKRGQNVKYLPYAFTEHGALMAANVLNSPRAVQMSVPGFRFESLAVASRPLQPLSGLIRSAPALLSATLPAAPSMSLLRIAPLWESDM